MTSPTKEEIKDALLFAKTCHKDKSLFPDETASIKALQDAYMETVEALREIVTAQTEDGRKIAIKSGKAILEKAPEEER